jgi:hypothetical protein
MPMFRSPLSRPAAAAGRKRYTPSLEGLEDRTAPSVCVVNNLGDTGVGVAADHGDLRFCVTRANALAGPDSITFSVTGTIKLKSNLPALAADMSIIGPGADLLAVDGQHEIGPIFNVDPGATVAISGLTVTHGYNDCEPGGISNHGTLVLKDSAVTENDNVGCWDAYGAGIWNSGTMTIWGTTVSGNLCIATIDCYGGGVYNSSGSMQILSSTVSGNNAGDGGGGGVANGGGTLDIRFSTITANFLDCCYGGSGLYTVGGTKLYDTIIAGNTGVADVYGPYTGSSNLIGGDPRLGPLANNGGHTQTHAVLPGSPALDAGDNTGAPQWDQRGPGFPRIVNGTIDIGAFEVQNTAGPAAGRSVLVTAPRPAPAHTGVPQPAPVEAPHGRPPADSAPAAVPGAAGNAAAPVLHVGHLTAAETDADPLGLSWL